MFEAFFSLFKLDVIVALASGVAIITQVLKAMPIEWTTNKGKVLAWFVSALVVGVVGVLNKADVVTITSVATLVALTSHGLYDVVGGFIKKLKD